MGHINRVNAIEVAGFFCLCVDIGIEEPPIHHRMKAMHPRLKKV
jgi:hypothetical protein